LTPKSLHPLQTQKIILNRTQNQNQSKLNDELISIEGPPTLVGGNEHLPQLAAHAHLNVKTQSAKMTLYTEIQFP